MSCFSACCEEPPEVEDRWALYCEFQVTVPTCDAPLGLSLDFGDESSGYVTSVNEGAIACWNELVSDGTGEQVQPGDYLYKVNETTGKAMRKELKSDTTLVLYFVRPQVFSVEIPTEEGEPMGLSLNWTPNGGTLLISMVNEGPVLAFCDANPDFQLKQGDRILSVNGIYPDERGGVAPLLAEFDAPDRTSMVLEVSRPFNEAGPGVSGGYDAVEDTEG